MEMTQSTQYGRFITLPSSGSNDEHCLAINDFRFYNESLSEILSWYADHKIKHVKQGVLLKFVNASDRALFSLTWN